MDHDLLALWQAPSTASTLAFLFIVLAVLAAAVAGVFVAWRGAAGGGVRAAQRAVAGLALWVALTGLYVGSGAIRGGLPAFVLFFAGSNVVAILVALSPVGGQLARHLPFAALAGFQAFRLPLELVLHRWYREGSMPLQMTYEGHNFDIVTGLAAVAVIVVALVRRTDVPRGVALAFNVLGSALLLGVIAIVLQSSPIPLRTYEGLPILLGFHLPYAWIAPVCVAGAMAGHVILWRKLLDPRCR